VESLFIPAPFRRHKNMQTVLLTHSPFLWRGIKSKIWKLGSGLFGKSYMYELKNVRKKYFLKGSISSWMNETVYSWEDSVTNHDIFNPWLFSKVPVSNMDSIRPWEQLLCNLSFYSFYACLVPLAYTLLSFVFLLHGIKLTHVQR
jgi:hypothetical protein